MTIEGPDVQETLEEFKNSFSYGARNHLSFKFLKQLSPDEAGEFFSDLLDALAESYDDGDVDRLIGVAFQWQVRAYRPAPGDKRRYVYEDRPFKQLAKPLSEAKVGLLTSSGHFVAGDDPEPLGVSDMTQEEAIDRISEFLREDPTLSSIPKDVERQDLMVRHGGYDVTSARRDPNVALPLEALAAAAASGRLGEFASPVYSFMGAAAQGRLRKKTGPDWAQQLNEAGIDALLLVPL